MIKILSLSAALIATAALAQPPGDGPATTKREVSGDPKEVICIKQSQIGSRIATRRVCRTRAEWAEHRTEFKQEVERAQQQMQTQY